mmetsp:Transcript_39048/g.86859  ORF Transcript_39048/g.86859 Transcript_39048/m.86859 type:complete len:208 (-) Transcript_39048:2426-3049(-)
MHATCCCWHLALVHHTTHLRPSVVPASSQRFLHPTDTNAEETCRTRLMPMQFRACRGTSDGNIVALISQVNAAEPGHPGAPSCNLPHQRAKLMTWFQLCTHALMASWDDHLYCPKLFCVQAPAPYPHTSTDFRTKSLLTACVIPGTLNLSGRTPQARSHYRPHNECAISGIPRYGIRQLTLSSNTLVLYNTLEIRHFHRPAPASRQV